ncbi:uncharacterized protein KY384_004736 [Bacidia gigantensis]|uniref:uncharacterized protein n=1 Tax=Bacidia gigantensis TaxID=2732470 RepID=UPI001D04C7D2|nr:uncharacterized protein KY384_004736 [Bacidia gigantensis]KAG8530236.1 hypothetical protein KY384_004736 [Bacidia gigantensis]
MAPIKRKAREDNPGTRPAKKQRASPAIALPHAEPAFPRGGASVLTPLEQKQIQIQAHEDVLFEQKTGNRSHREDFDNAENEEDLPTQKQNGVRKQKSRPKSKLKRLDSSAVLERKGVRIEGMSYKRLAPGSLLLGQVIQINRHDIALSLPNNLTGYVSFASISDTINRKLEALAEDEEEDGDEDTSEDNVDLPSMFSIGQYLRACVLSTEDERHSTSKGKRHIGLSIDPRQANKGLSPPNLVPHLTVQASVTSVEDHGLIMDLGLEDSSVKGFMSSKELGTDKTLSEITDGAVFLCMVTGKSANGKTIKLSMDPIKLGGVKKGAYLADAPTVDVFLPGTAVELMVSETTKSGVAGKVMGMVDVTADIMHTGAASHIKDIEKKFPSGIKLKGRILCTFPTSEEMKVGVSFEHHIIQWKEKTSGDENSPPIKKLPLSAIVKEAKVVKVEPSIGVFMDVGVPSVRGFAHISKLTDGKVETLSETTGSFRVGSIHPARVIGYNSMDGLFILSLEPKILKQPFLRLEDVKTGQLVNANVEKTLIGGEGVTGLILNLAEGVSGLVSENHFADVRLQHPEKRFTEGINVTARVLSVEPSKRQVRLTLKKSLINSDIEPWVDYGSLEPGMQSPGTLISVSPNGAVVYFYGRVKAFLPKSEMSETFIQDPQEHFRVGQVVNVRVVTVDAEKLRMIVSCKEPSAFGTTQQEAFTALQVGTLVEGIVTEKTNDNLILELQPSQLKGRLPVEQLTDGTTKKSISTLEHVRVGQTMKSLLVFNKQDKNHLVQLSSKPSMIKAAAAEKVPRNFEDVKKGTEVTGYVNNITSTSVFVQFLGNLSALLLKRHLSDEAALLPDFGMRLYQPITAFVLSIDYSERKFLLSNQPVPVDASEDSSLLHPIDETLTSFDELKAGKITKARINHVKATQLNVQLADGVQGRVGISSAFDSWDDIKDPKSPLSQFKPKEVIQVRILGMHDARNHKFLPITHRTKQPVFELTMKRSDLEAPELDILTIAKIEKGSKWTVFVNNVESTSLWVNLSPNVRSRIKASNLTNDVVAPDLAKDFPIGSALRVRVVKVNPESGHIDLSAKGPPPRPSAKFEDLSQGQVLAGRITKITDRQLMVQLGEDASGAVHLVDMADDYSKANPRNFHKDQIIQVCIKEIDLPNKRMLLSSRPSQTLSSSLPVEDPDIESASQIQVNDIRRGFIKFVADGGIHISLSSKVNAFVRVADLTDLYVKDWKSGFEIDQLVKGKILAVEASAGRISMSLRRSHIDKDYKPPMLFTDVEVGQIVTGKVRKVKDYGVFVVFDDSANVSGLCHRSAMSDNKDLNPQKVYEEGDPVKAKVLNLNQEKRQISLGLKASYFADVPNGVADERVMIDSMNDDDNDDDQSMIDANESEDNEAEKPSMNGVALEEHEDEESDEDSAEVEGHDLDIASDDEGGGITKASSLDRPSLSKEFKGLSAGGFDWTGDSVFGSTNIPSPSASEDEATLPRKKRKRRAEIKVDRTGDLDVNGPQSGADFERLLLSQPNSSVLWLGYMAFQLQLGEVETARDLAERALKTIYIREEGEKFNVWIALLNLENTYGNEEALDGIFKRACQHNDSQDIHERLVSIYIQANQSQKADDLFQATVKKFTQSPDLYFNYATFLMTTLNEPDRARALLPRAMQALPPHTHLNLTSRFAQLEFKSPNGEAERGRTIFETLVSQWPKRLDLWNVLLDLEINQGEKEKARKLFERVTGSGMKLKARKAKFFFKRWLEFEERSGDEKSQAKVKRLAAEYVREHEKTDG